MKSSVHKVQACFTYVATASYEAQRQSQSLDLQSWTFAFSVSRHLLTMYSASHSLEAEGAAPESVEDWAEAAAAKRARDQRNFMMAVT